MDGKDLWSFIQYSSTNDDTADFIYDEDTDTGGRELLLDMANTYCHYSSCGALLYRNRWKYLRGNNLCFEGVDCNAWNVSYMTNTTNSLGCESYESVSNSNSITSLNCLDTENGCLIDLFADPCEYKNVANSHAAVLKKLQMRLDAYSAVSVVALDSAMNVLHDDDINPSLVCPNDFWCPYQKWSDVTFEKVLFNNYIKLYSSSTAFLPLDVSLINSVKTDENVVEIENSRRLFDIYNHIYIEPIIVVLLFAFSFYICGYLKYRNMSLAKLVQSAQGERFQEEKLSGVTETEPLLYLKKSINLCNGMTSCYCSCDQ